MASDPSLPKRRRALLSINLMTVREGKAAAESHFGQPDPIDPADAHILGRRGVLTDLWPPVSAVIRAVAIPVIVSFVLVLRRPEAVFRSQFAYEEPYVFYAAAHSGGVLETILTPWAGMLQLFPRLVHAGLLLVPGEIAPAISMLVLYLAIGLIAGFMASDRMAAAIPSRRVRVAFALSFAIVPATAGPLVSILNAHWFGAIYLIALSIATYDPRWRWADRIGAGLMALTGPTSIILAPLFWRRRDLLVIVGIGAAIQILFVLNAPPRSPPLDPVGTLIVLMERVGQSVLGSRTGTSLAAIPAIPLTVTLAAAVALAVSGLPWRTTAVFAYGTGAIAASGIVKLGPAAFADPTVGIRYFIPIVIFLLLVAIAGIGARRFLVVPLAAALVVGVIGDVRMYRLPDRNWPEAAACIETPGPCLVEVYPHRWSFHWPDGLPPTMRPDD